jgi:diadenosine tetraphosphate (Ap4A) HIT family hydrolase
MKWPPSFYEMRDGVGCPMCTDARPDETPHGARFFLGEVTDAHLRRADIQRGLSIVMWRGRHVVEPTELGPDEAATFWRELLEVGRAIEATFEPVKLNYNLLGNEVPHLHAHVVPRYADDPRPGWPFPFPEDAAPDIPEDRFRADLTALRRTTGYQAR